MRNDLISGIFEEVRANSHTVFPTAAKQHCNLREFFVQNRDVANILFLSIHHKVSQYTCSRTRVTVISFTP